jgi:hypothetical protein
MFEKQAARCAAFAFLGLLKTRSAGAWGFALTACQVNDIACPCLAEICKDRADVMVRRIVAPFVAICL